jgi:DNA-binding transcriptional ArsR family regulator
MNMEIMQEKCEEVASLLKNFSHPQRLLILCYLSDGEKQVSDIHEVVGLSQSQTSQFLKRMQIEGLLKLRREKNYSFYSIANSDVIKLLKSMQKIFCA